MIQNNCVFCRRNEGTTYEDAWSMWLRKAWQEFSGNPNEKFLNTLSKGSVTNPELLRQWPGRHRIGGFCEFCNNRWMSRMEDTVKPILKPMMFGQRVTLTPQAQKRLARWAYMKSLVFTLSTPEIEIPDAEYDRFYKSKKPPHRASIFLMQSKMMFAGMLYHLETVEEPTEKGVVAENFRSIFVMGHVVVQVVGSRPISDNPVLLARPRTTDWAQAIWPARGSLTWPLARSLDPQLVARMLDFFHEKKKREQSGPAA